MIKKLFVKPFCYLNLQPLTSLADIRVSSDWNRIYRWPALWWREYDGVLVQHSEANGCRLSAILPKSQVKAFMGKWLTTKITKSWAPVLGMLSGGSGRLPILNGD